MLLNGAALFLWLGTSIAAVSAVDTRPPSFNLAVRNHDNPAKLYRRAFANYDNGLYDRDLADLSERDVDDFIKRGSLDNQVYQVDKRLFDDGDEIDRRGELKAIVKGIVKLGRKIAKGVRRIKESIKKSHERKKDFGNHSNSTLSRRADYNGIDEIDRRGELKAIVKGIVKLGRKIAKGVRRIKESIKKSHERHRNNGNNSNSTLFRRADDDGLYSRDLANSSERELDNQEQRKERGLNTTALVAQFCIARPEFNWLLIHGGNVHFDGDRGKDWGHKQVELPFRKIESYDVYYGKNGTAERTGAGGSLNWAFCGKFNRENNGSVTFFTP